MKATFSCARLDASSIRLLSWNVYKGKKTKWKNDFHQLSQNQDIILIQEAYLNQKMTHALDIKGMGWNFAASFIYRRKGIPTGVLTVSKARPVSSDFLKTQYHEPIVNTPKMSLLTRYPLAKTRKNLMVVNVHAINFVGIHAFVSQLDDLEKNLQKHTGPMILGGDFNTWNEERMRCLMQMTERLELHSISFSPDHRNTMFGHPLDHVFFKGLTLKTARVIKDIRSSDHRPIIAEFETEYLQ